MTALIEKTHASDDDQQHDGSIDVDGSISALVESSHSQSDHRESVFLDCHCCGGVDPKKGGCQGWCNCRQQTMTALIEKTHASDDDQQDDGSISALAETG